MQISATELAHLLNGVIEGDPSVKVSRPGTIESAQEGEICFLGNPKYESYAYTTEASILLVDRNFQPKSRIKPTLIRVDNVYTALSFLLEKFGQATQQEARISPLASIHPSVILGKNVNIGDFTIIEEGCIIGNGCHIQGQVWIGRATQLGSNCTIQAGVKIYPRSQIAECCIIHTGAVIGSDGFGFVPQPDGTYKKIHHTGNVVIESDVEIGANTTIDRASIGSTIIRKGVKLDNLIQVAHNVEIGENTVIAAQTGIAGSTKIGKNCRIGGQVGIVGHITIGNNVQIQAQSGITSNIPDDSKLFGSPAMNYTDFLRSFTVFKKLPDLDRKIQKLFGDG